MGHDSARAQKTGRDALVSKLSCVRSGEGDAGSAAAGSDRAGHARYAGAPVECRSARGARPRTKESSARRSGKGSRRQSSPRRRDDRRVRGVSDVDGKARQRRDHDGHHHVATENARDTRDTRDTRQVVLHDRSLARVLDIARGYIASRTERPVWPTVSLESLREALGGTLPDNAIDPVEVVDALARAADPGLVTTT